MAHTPSHDDYLDKLRRLADHIKAHPEEARAGVAKLSSGAQGPAGEIIKNFVSGKDPKVIYEENHKILAGLPASVRAEIDNHKTDLAHKIGILTLAEILERLEKLAEHIRAHPDEARARVGRLSSKAQKPAGDIIKIFVSAKTPKEKFEESRKILDSLPSDVRGEINALKEDLAHKIGIVPIHHLGHTHTHGYNDYIDKLHRLSEHIKEHPEKAAVAIAKLSSAAQKPAGQLLKLWLSDKDPQTKYEEAQKIKAGLPAAVRAEIENHKTDLAHKIGILTLDEILERLEKLALHIKAHPDEARARVAKLSSAAQYPAGEIIHIFVSDRTPKEKREASQKILESLPSEVAGEINALKEEIAHKIGIVPLHHLGHATPREDYMDKLHRLAEHIKKHPEEARAGVAKLSAAAQGPAGEIIKIFVSDKDPKTKYDEIQNIKAGLPAHVKAEIEAHKTELAHKVGILTLKEILVRLELLANWVKNHPDDARARVGKLSAAAQKPAGELIKNFVSGKEPKVIFEENQKTLAALPAEIRGEIQAFKEDIARKIGIVPLHHLGRTHTHEDYADKLHRLAEHIKAHPEEARAGVLKLSAAAQQPAGEIIKIFVSDKDPWVKLSEIQHIKEGLPAAVRAEIEEHKTELAHKIGILTIHEILERLEKLADHIKAHPDEARARIAKLSPAAQKPAGDIIKIFVSDKLPRDKRSECQAILQSLPAEVRGEIQALKEDIANKIGITPLHHLGKHTHAHDDYVDKLNRLAEHIKAHPEEARAGIAKLSSAAQKPAGELIKIFISDKSPLEKFEESKKLKAGLPASVRAEIDNHKTDLAHKIGILTLDEIVARLEKLADHIRAHPEEAKAGVLKLSAAAQGPAAEIIKIFVSDKTPKEKFTASRAILDSLPSEVRGEINAHKEQLSRRLRITPLHHLAYTHAHDDYVDKIHRLADYIKAHPEEARAGVAKLSTAAQQPAGEIIKIFVSDKDAFVKLSEIEKIKSGLPASVRAEIENHKADLAHKIGILTLPEILERLEKLADHIKAHPDEARARIAQLSTAAQRPFGDIVKIFVSDKTPREKRLECQTILQALPSEVRGEIQAVKEELARKIGIAPIHHLGHTHAYDDYFDKLHRLAEHIKAHPDEARAGVAKLSKAAQGPAAEIIKNFVSDKDPKTKYEDNQKILAGLPASVRAEIQNHKADLAHKIGLLTLEEILERLEKLADHIKANPEQARARVAQLSAAAQKPAGDIIKIFVSDKTPKEKRAESQHILEALPSDVRGEINVFKEELANKIGIVPLHHH